MDLARVKDLFAAAEGLAKTERGAWLAGECGGDVELRREVEQLLEAGACAEGFLETPPLLEPGFVGRQVGAWRLVAEVGRGGMGVVYRAVREEEGFRQEAALKLLRSDRGLSGVVSRFEQERRILARLRHPGIATLLDGGRTEDGEPWLAMEYVDGEPLHDYCTEAGLGVRERLQLFREVCGAVAYAHRNLVVHRDLKPSNILVNREGRVKLLDFGIARLLEGETTEVGAAETATLLPALTPEYASPEQVKGEAVTTSSDVYSLGVVLFELLTGGRPYKVGRSAEEIVRAVCATEPPRPSALLETESSKGESPTRPLGAPAGVTAGELEGDLDTIVLKALRKEPERRYASVTDLEDDVRRHLEGLPVRARPDTVRYRAGKFVSRHRGATVAGLVAVASLVLGVAATLRQARIAEWNRARAERRFAETRKLANTLVFDLNAEVAKLPGSLKAREKIVSSGTEYLEGLSRDAEGDVDLQLELAAGWMQLGTLLGGVTSGNLGDRGSADRAYRKALDLAAAARRAEPRNATACRRLGEVQLRLGLLAYAGGDFPGSLAFLDSAVEAQASAEALTPGDLEVRLAHAMARRERAYARGLNNRLPEARDEVRQVAALLEDLLREHPRDTNLRNQLAAAIERLGQIEQAIEPGQPATLVALKRGIELREAILAENLGDAKARQRLMASYSNLAETSGAAHDLPGAIAAMDRALAIAEDLSRSDPANVQQRSDLAFMLQVRADLETRSGRPRAALPLLDRAQSLYGELLAADPGHAQTRLRVADLPVARGKAWAALARSGRPEERASARARARAFLAEAQGLWSRLDGEGLLSGTDRESLQALEQQVAALDRPAASVTATPKPPASAASSPR
jgi:non-specific serine/threonine protein kinase/serine/threonine-protein kinase